MTMSMRPPPPYPPDTRAKGWRFEIDHERIHQSDTWALASACQRPWLLMLWLVAWQQTPCGSLPDNDELIAARLGMPPDEFEQHRAILLRGWQKANDGRLYHQVISQIVLEMLRRKTRETERKADYRSRQKALDVPTLSHGTDAGRTRESGGNDDTGTGTSRLPTSNDVGCHQAPPDDQLVCPHQQIIAIYHQFLPANPQIRKWTPTRAAHLRARWAEDKSRQSLEYWQRFFAYVAESAFLTGQASSNGRRPFTPGLEWLVKDENFTKIREGRYHQESSA